MSSYPHFVFSKFPNVGEVTMMFLLLETLEGHCSAPRVCTLVPFICICILGPETMDPFSNVFCQEEMSYSSTLKAELKKLEELSQKSGDQTVEELRAVRQMFEQSEESRNAS